MLYQGMPPQLTNDYGTVTGGTKANVQFSNDVKARVVCNDCADVRGRLPNRVEPWTQLKNIEPEG